MSLQEIGHSHNTELFGNTVDTSGAEIIWYEAKAEH